LGAELRATYRLQLGPELTFEGALEYVPYLRELGVSHLYLSVISAMVNTSQQVGGSGYWGPGCARVREWSAVRCGERVRPRPLPAWGGGA
jgi:hypothetical protein